MEAARDLRQCLESRRDEWHLDDTQVKLAGRGFQCIESNLPIPEISRVMGVSESTMTHRIRQYDFTPRSERFTDISQSELVDIVRDIHSRNPYSGYRMVLANLRSRGLTLQQNRVRRALRDVDPIDALHWAGPKTLGDIRVVRSTMVHLCAMVGCGNRSNRDRNVSFYRLPSIRASSKQAIRDVRERRRRE